MTSLIVISGWDPPIIAKEALAERHEITSALALMDVPIKSAAVAQAAADIIAQARRFESDIEERSQEVRKPYFDHAKAIKACSDEFQRLVMTSRMKVERQLANWEAEQIRIKQNLERQAREEAERKRREEIEAQRREQQKRDEEAAREQERLRQIRIAAEAAQNANEQRRLQQEAEIERQRIVEATKLRQQQEEQERQRLAAIAPAPVTWEAPKAEGISAGVEVEYDITDDRAFAEWCWRTGREDWVREISFERRSIKSMCDKIPETGPLPEVPGLSLKRVAAVRVAKAKKAQRALNAVTTMVEM